MGAVFVRKCGGCGGCGEVSAPTAGTARCGTQCAAHAEKVDGPVGDEQVRVRRHAALGAACGRPGSCVHGVTVTVPAPGASRLPKLHRPGRHLGHPTAVGGLPVSKPGLVADAHDLSGRYLRQRPEHLSTPVQQVERPASAVAAFDAAEVEAAARRPVGRRGGGVRVAAVHGVESDQYDPRLDVGRRDAATVAPDESARVDVPMSSASVGQYASRWKQVWHLSCRTVTGTPSGVPRSSPATAVKPSSSVLRSPRPATRADSRRSGKRRESRAGQSWNWFAGTGSP